MATYLGCHFFILFSHDFCPAIFFITVFSNPYVDRVTVNNQAGQQILGGSDEKRVT
ncbi:hypothetical protein MSG37_11995 [Shewanella sp. 1CM18E]|uniref:hypothetical protein n=1 Tax=Shewanella sp. 1CM18E TaxID=2929169 RepID=UPI0020BEA4FB|nr:hypothetical protein [Shewanella sp. 1CM18E]MCK8045605.1 hypothetical protein [Shewanella sp. 1CM18E]